MQMPAKFAFGDETSSKEQKDRECEKETKDYAICGGIIYGRREHWSQACLLWFDSIIV